MSHDEAMQNAIQTRLATYDYKSANFRLALVKENDFWKVAIARIILDVLEPKGQDMHLKQDDFVLVDFSLSIDEFKQFLEYLKHVYVGNITIKGNTIDFTDDLLFKLGDYKLCFVGNFPSPEPYFYGREVARTYHGIDKPVFLAEYAISGLASSKLLYHIQPTSSEVPFRNVIEALNYYWHTDYQQYSMPMNSNIYFPNYDASIENFTCEKKHAVLQIDIDTKRVKISDLSVGLILEAKTGKYRKKHFPKDHKLELNLDFEPDYGTIYLYKNEKKIDELNYQSSAHKAFFEKITGTVEVGIPTGEEGGVVEEVSSTIEEERIFSHEFVKELPEHIQLLVYEADEAYRHKLYRATAILLRTTLEEGLTIAIKHAGREPDKPRIQVCWSTAKRKSDSAKVINLRKREL
ncbi:MAG: hypothetical protein ACREA3_03170 [Nitrosotalea sp.]